MAISYRLPSHWIRYDQATIFNILVEAKANVGALRTTPYQRDWIDKLQQLQFKMEVAGTSQIEGAEFSERELDQALEETAEGRFTRSQKQARAAANTYRWIADLPPDLPITESLIREIHRRMVTGCDDDHCEPGALRRQDDNVVFGVPPHRGCEGGAPCQRAFSQFTNAIGTEYRSHDPLIQAMAVHYHFAAMHPFQDGNGRTARALEALLLQRAGLRDSAFIAMSNYYYEEKPAYLKALSAVRSADHDLTAFLHFALTGVARQCERMLQEIKRGVHKAVFRNTMFDLFGRLTTPRKRVIARRQLEILKLLLDSEKLRTWELVKKTAMFYGELSDPTRAFSKDLSALLHLGAITGERLEEEKTFLFRINLDWPSQIREGEFFERIKELPKAKTHRFL
ncbi:MAG TPA: Fic family protein [Bryobacterales bacterium]|nr:Fic family protein [Bryobacterales bacterium]